MKRAFVLPRHQRTFKKYFNYLNKPKTIQYIAEVKNEQFIINQKQYIHINVIKDKFLNIKDKSTGLYAQIFISYLHTVINILIKYLNKYVKENKIKEIQIQLNSTNVDSLFFRKFYLFRGEPTTIVDRLFTEVSNLIDFNHLLKIEKIYLESLNCDFNISLVSTRLIEIKSTEE